MLTPPKTRVIRAARGNTLSARSWMTEAPLRMLMNNLDAEVAENPAELVVYGGIGRAARAHCEFQSRAALGDLGTFPRARSQGIGHVRPDDRGFVDLHR